MAEKRRLPIGVQDFEKLRKNNYVYIDKTEYIYRMTHANANYLAHHYAKSLFRG